jgi:hypothetical protein
MKVYSTDLPSITIDWTPPDFNGGIHILQYNIYVDDQYAGQVDGSTQLYTEDTLLSLGVASEFKVSAVNVIGEGAKSIGTSIIAATVPYQPDAVTRKDAAAYFIQPEWTAPQDGGTPIRGYRVYKNGIKVSEVDWN